MLSSMETESTWKSRVAAWRASGMSAAEFCARKEFSVSALRHWAGKLTKIEAERPEVRIAKVVASGSIPDVDTPLVLEVGGIRIAVRRGFDREVLRDVLAVLGSRSA